MALPGGMACQSLCTWDISQAVLVTVIPCRMWTTAACAAVTVVLVTSSCLLKGTLAQLPARSSFVQHTQFMNSRWVNRCCCEMYQLPQADSYLVHQKLVRLMYTLTTSSCLPS